MFFHFVRLLRARHRDRLDFGMDCGDVGFMRWHPNADADANSHTNSDAYPNTYTNPYADTNPNTDSGAKFCVQHV